MSTQVRAEEPMLDVVDLEVAYGNVVAATDVSLHVDRGEIVCLLGPNGAGKTSVLKSIMGLVPPRKGTVTYVCDGARHEVAGMPTHALARLGIGTVPSLNPILPRMTVLENLEVGLIFFTSDKKRVQQAIGQAFERFPKLAERRQQIAGTLSGGEQRALAIARALMARPKMLLMDEPSLGLAPIPLAEIFGFLSTINREEKMSILLVEQNIKKALEIAHRAYVMRIGGIDFSGPSAEVAASERLHNAYLGS